MCRGWVVMESGVVAVRLAGRRGAWSSRRWAKVYDRPWWPCVLFRSWASVRRWTLPVDAARLEEGLEEHEVRSAGVDEGRKDGRTEGIRLRERRASSFACAYASALL